MDLRVLNNRIIVRRSPTETETKSGIVFAVTSQERMAG